MPWAVAAAVVGAAGSYAASKKSSDATKKGIKTSKELSSQARQDAMDLFDRSSQDGRSGITGAFDFYRNSMPKRINPYVQGNMAAQGVIGQGAQQANNAILGLPVDMSFTQPQAIQYDQSYLADAKLPEPPPPEPEPEPDVIGAAPAAKKPSMKDEYKPSNQLKKHQDKKLKKLKSLF